MNTGSVLEGIARKAAFSGQVSLKMSLPKSGCGQVRHRDPTLATGQKTKAVKLTPETTNRDVVLFVATARAAEETHARLGFGSPATGVLHHRELKLELLPLWDRGDEPQKMYALHSAYGAGRRKGSRE
jgi:hypothetical protein